MLRPSLNKASEYQLQPATRVAKVPQWVGEGLGISLYLNPE